MDRMDTTTNNNNQQVVRSCWKCEGAAGVSDVSRRRRRHHNQNKRRQALGFVFTLMFYVTAPLQLLLMFRPCHAVSSPYDCDAMGSFEDLQRTEGVTSQQLQPQEEEEDDDDDAFYAIGTPGPEAGAPTPEPYDVDMMPSSPLADKTQPPSMAPSVSQPCSDPLSNARGQYTSTLAPCVVKFHNANIQREGRQTTTASSSNPDGGQNAVIDEAEFIEYRTSDLCNDDNVIVQIHEYVQAWPDECVGDFDRCYSLQHHFSLLCDFLCERQEDGYSTITGGGGAGLFPSPNQQQQSPASPSFSYRPHWELPEGTTHVSVTCTRDKELVLEQTEREERAERDERRNAKRDAFQTKLFNGLVVFVSALTIIFALSQLIVAPLVAVATTIASSSSSGRSDCTSSRNDFESDDDTENFESSHLSVRRDRRRRYSFLERRSSSISSLPFHHQEADALILEEDGSVVQGIVYADEGDIADVVAARGSSSASSRGCRQASVHSHPNMVEDEDDEDHYHDQAESDFDSQVPLDFDAVPIATIPVVTATVLDDGITYS